jgi:hypothetical protein
MVQVMNLDALGNPVTHWLGTETRANRIPWMYAIPDIGICTNTFCSSIVLQLKREGICWVVQEVFDLY